MDYTSLHPRTKTCTIAGPGCPLAGLPRGFGTAWVCTADRLGLTCRYLFQTLSSCSPLTSLESTAVGVCIWKVGLLVDVLSDLNSCRSPPGYPSVLDLASFLSLLCLAFPKRSAIF